MMMIMMTTMTTTMDRQCQAKKNNNLTTKLYSRDAFSNIKPERIGASSRECRDCGKETDAACRENRHSRENLGADAGQTPPKSEEEILGMPLFLRRRRDIGSRESRFKRTQGEECGRECTEAVAEIDGEETP
jgi:hypothetical protein